MRFFRLAGMAGAVAMALLLGHAAMPAAWIVAAAAAAKKSDPLACDRAAFRLVVDVGHTAKAYGARSARGALEYDFNLRLAKQIEQQLIAAGFEKTVLMVTDGRAQASLSQRVALTNRLAPDLFLSIHHDSVPDSMLEKWEYEGERFGFSDRFRGHSIFISNDNPERAASLSFASLLGKELKTRGLQYTPHYTSPIMGRRQRILVDADAGVYRYDQLRVLRETHIPAVLLEAGSIINRDEELLLKTPEHQALIGAAVTDALDGYCATHPHRPRLESVQQKGKPAAQPATRVKRAGVP
jgi:N-acetylmuramoyl-L-alanine amidase